ncbi:MAG: hypothetical protein BRD49_05540 [Bacteroidetes bacterium SW_10_40_5]|nr:MAG: hypothetical protein BRD49_05540 [Bacteroidetes bacterium SW_10_40_5]
MITKLVNENVSVRASAIAFNFFLALVPAFISLFTLIPYIPVENLSQEVTAMLRELMPTNTFKTIETTVKEILETRRGGLMSISFLFSIHFATNGISSLIDSFNRDETRPFWLLWVTSFGLMVVLISLLVVGIVTFIGGEFLLNNLFDTQLFEDNVNKLILKLFQIVIILLIIFMGVSLLYFFGSNKKSRLSLFSYGAYLATLLILISSYGFAFYVENFSQFNKIYGSLGTLIVLNIWLYITATVLIIGYELNKSIIMAKKEKKEELPTDPDQ